MPIEVDWRQAWIDAQKARRRADDSAYWDKRAPSFAKTCGTSPYARTFIERAQLEGGETVFDMGCGSGTLAVPLALAGHEVYAADFSPAMIELMMRRARVEGVEELIHPIEMSWDEEWKAAPVCDVAFASRSIATQDMAAALLKLDAHARRRVCITLATDTSPRADEVLLQAVGRTKDYASDYVYGMNILWQLGFQPDLSYIRSKRASDFTSFEEAIDTTCEIIEATPEERDRLIEYSRAHLHEGVNEQGEAVWSYDHVRVTSWAFISWENSSVYVK